MAWSSTWSSIRTTDVAGLLPGLGSARRSGVLGRSQRSSCWLVGCNSEEFPAGWSAAGQQCPVWPVARVDGKGFHLACAAHEDKQDPGA